MQLKLFKWLPDNAVYVSMSDIVSIAINTDDDPLVTLMMMNSKLYQFTMSSNDFTSFLQAYQWMIELLATDPYPGMMIWGGSVGIDDSEAATILQALTDAR